MGNKPSLCLPRRLSYVNVTSESPSPSLLADDNKSKAKQTSSPSGRLLSPPRLLPPPIPKRLAYVNVNVNANAKNEMGDSLPSPSPPPPPPPPVTAEIRQQTPPTTTPNKSDRPDYPDDSEEAHPPDIYHANLGSSQRSLTSQAVQSSCSTDLESIDSCTGETSLSDLSVSSSTAFLNLKRKKQPTKKRRRPTALNAFETLPRHLIRSALVRQATTTLTDERFVQRRIVKLGPVAAAKIHVGDLLYLHKRAAKDYLRRMEKGVDAAVPLCSTFRDGDGAASVMLESFGVFVTCVLRLCGVRTTDPEPTPVDGGSARADTVPTTTAQETDGPSARLRTIASPDAGRAIYLLAKCVHGKELNEEAISFYRSALFLFLSELEVREPSLIDRHETGGGDCTGFFYVRIATAGAAGDGDGSPVHRDIATVLTKMGDIHGRNDEVNDALRSYRASQVFWTRYLAERRITSVTDCGCAEDMDELDDHAAAVEGLALTHNRIGGVYCAKGDLGVALRSFGEAMEMQLRALGPDHLEVAKTLHNIGVSHRHNKDLDKALEYYHRALRIFELNLGKEHLDTVRTLHNIGGVYRRQKEYNRAMSCFQDVLKVRRALLGDCHPSVAITLVSIAAVLRRSGNKEEANKYYSEAMK